MTTEKNNLDRPAEFDARVVAHLPMLRKLVKNHCNPDDREELVQETAMHALAKWRNFRPDGRFHEWLRFQLMNIMKTRKQQSARRRNHTVDDPTGHFAISAKTDAVQEDATYLGQITERLNETRGGQMLLSHVAGEHQYDIAMAHSTSRSNAQRLCGIARQNIQKVAA